MFFRLGPKIFPEKIFKREIFPVNLKGLAKITKELECLRANLYAHCRRGGGGCGGGETKSNP